MSQAPLDQVQPVPLSGLHTWPVAQICVGWVGPNPGGIPSRSHSWACLPSGTPPPSPVPGRAGMDGPCSFSTISYSGHCHSVLPASLGEEELPLCVLELATSSITSVQGLLGSWHIHCDVSK